MPRCTGRPAAPLGDRRPRPATGPPAGSTTGRRQRPAAAGDAPAGDVDEVPAAAHRLLPVHRLGRDHHQLLHPADDPRRPGQVADHQVPGPDEHRRDPLALRAVRPRQERRASGSQYVDYWEQLFHGDLGLSFTFFPTPVSEVIADEPAVDRRAWSASPPSSASCSAPALGVLRRLAARLLGRRAAAGHHVPVVGPVLLARPHRDRPARRAGQLLPVLRRLRRRAWCRRWDQYFIGSAIQHSLLPALTILISSVSGWILGMRNMMVTVASEDYITVAHAKGLSERRVMLELRGPQRAAAQRLRLRAVAGLHRRRHPAGGDRLLLPGPRLPAVPGASAPRTTR